MAEGATKLITFTKVQPGATAGAAWNNAFGDVYHLNAWPKVAPGVTGSAELVQVKTVIKADPVEKELHFTVKNTGSTVIDIDVWAFWWAWPIGAALEAIRADFNVPALGGAIVTTGGVAALDVAGIRKHGNTTKVEAGDRWHLGSDTKAMTATLVAVLAQKGQVDWDWTVADVFTEWASTMKAMFKDMTFERLMAHRSGIIDTKAAESTALADTAKTITARRKEVAKLVIHRNHTGGENFLYHNWNFVLVGAMLERVTGASWEDLMNTHVFTPLGMTTAGYGPRAAPAT